MPPPTVTAAMIHMPGMLTRLPITLGDLVSFFRGKIHVQFSFDEAWISSWPLIQ